MNQGRNTGIVRGRLLLYTVGLSGIAALDIITPLGVADWLLEVIVVWIASLLGSRKEIRVVAAVCTVTMLVGLWSSPVTVIPFWMGALNRLVAIGVIWTMVNTSERRRSAEQAERDATSQLKIMQGFLPICSVCKSIRDESGDWHKLETYLSVNSEARLTHGYCPGCAAELLEELEREGPKG